MDKKTDTKKKVYVSPRVTKYGSVAKLTQGGSGSFVDLMTTMAMLMDMDDD